MNANEITKLHRAADLFLSYVNPWIEYNANGTVSAHKFFTLSHAWMQASMPLMRKGGVDVVTLSHGVPDEPLFPGGLGVECLMKCFDALIGEIERDPKYTLILTRKDLDPATRRGKMGVLLHITSAPFNGDIANLRNYFRLGVRGIHPFANHPQLGGYAGGPKRLGLQRFGKEVIREMERLGMVVDLAHTNDRTFADALRFARKPLIDSHTNCRAIADHDRCVTDDQLRAIAKVGGVVGVHFGFVEPPAVENGPGYDKMMRAFYKKQAAMKRKYKEPYEYLSHRNDPYEWPVTIGGAIDDGTVMHRAKISQLGDHVEHMVDVAGIDHVGIGTDYAGGAMPQGVETAATLVNLTRELVRRGFRTQDIKKIWGGNFLRVYRECLPAN